MDEFSLDRPELIGALISLEFGAGGRIQQLWCSDPTLPEENEEFQFVSSPVTFGGEFVEDYLPGTILIGARTSPSEPWIVSRNSDATHVDEDDLSQVTFQYHFALLPEIQAYGRFHEVPNSGHQIVWDITLTNRGRVPVEIGELAFPLALNTVYEGFGKGLEELGASRVRLHKFIGGAASYLLAERMGGQSPSLLILPGEDTSWELYTHIPASLNGDLQWEGIPVVYIHSRAAVEREGWPNWFNGHTSFTLEPRESKSFQMRFVPMSVDPMEALHKTLVSCGRPSMRLLPGAIAPRDVGIAVEINGATPVRFFADVEADLETDSDEEGGFCFVRPKSPGPVRLSFEDEQGRISHAHLLFTEPLEDLIRQRAAWIVSNQVHSAPGSNLHNAIVCTNIRTNERMIEPFRYEKSFGLLCSLIDALFLAEKNTIYPEPTEIATLETYLKEFIQDDIQNPANYSVGSIFEDERSVASGQTRPQPYLLLACLYYALYQISRTYRLTAGEPQEYLVAAARTIRAMYAQADLSADANNGLPLYAKIPDLIAALKKESLTELAAEIEALMTSYQSSFLRRVDPVSESGIWTNAGLEELFYAGRALRDENAQRKALKLAMSSRSLAPCWWWYGSESRFSVRRTKQLKPAIRDRGELCFSPNTIAHSLMFLESLDRDVASVTDTSLRLATGGLLTPWALVRSDGAASMAFCPDAASRQFGAIEITGDSSLALYQYLCGTASYVLPAPQGGVLTLGCHFEQDADEQIVRPWDGVGRKIVMKQNDLEVCVQGARLYEFRVDTRKRFAQVKLQNSLATEGVAEIEIRGLWGNLFEVGTSRVEANEGVLRFSAAMPATSISGVEIKVIG